MLRMFQFSAEGSSGVRHYGLPPFPLSHGQEPKQGWHRQFKGGFYDKITELRKGFVNDVAFNHVRALIEFSDT